MAEEWITVEEATERFSIAKRTLWRRIREGKVVTKKDKGRRLVSAESVAAMVIATTYAIGGDAGTLAEHLRRENERLWERVEVLEAELKRKDEQAEVDRERFQTIILQQTRLLDDQRQPFWRRWFRRR